MSLTNHAPVTTDWCTEAGAHELAELIRAYWADRGKSVRIDIERPSKRIDDKKFALYCVRSDMIRGWPQPALVIGRYGAIDGRPR